MPELLEGGRNAFPEIIRQIRTAEHEITVHMFIWREDRIGTEIARELLAAADRGVKITIEKDMYAVTLEYAEESQRSLCHRPDLMDRLNISVLKLIYNRELNMLHSKLLMNERRVIIGSCNINRMSFTKLDELAITADNDNSPFASQIRASIEEAFQDADCVSPRDRIRYNPVLAALETAVM